MNTPSDIDTLDPEVHASPASHVVVATSEQENAPSQSSHPAASSIVPENEDVATIQPPGVESPNGAHDHCKQPAEKLTAAKSKIKKKTERTAAKEEPEDWKPRSEKEGSLHAYKLRGYIEQHQGQYLRDEDGSLHLIINGRRIPLNYDPGNLYVAKLMLDVCDITSLSPGAKAAIQRIQVQGEQKASRIHLRYFSALSEDGARLYIPVHGGRLLLITADKIELVTNGNNQDHLWLEHRYDEPLKYSPVDPKIGLEHFERLLVETQSCKQVGMRWLVAMQEGLFPFIRDGFPARFITEHIGPTQQGKTSGAQRFTLLHGLGEVKGDVSVAMLSNERDMGLLVLDNKEQANFSPPLIDYFLFLATGAEHGRSSPEGKNRTSRGRGRPVGVITTIEGVSKQELLERVVEVEYQVTGEKEDRGPIEDEIRKHRHEIGTAITIVLQRYLQIRGKTPTPNPVSNFKANFQAAADLLRAFGQVAKKTPEWAEKIIDSWAATINGREQEENELEHPILRVLGDGSASDSIGSRQTRYTGREGKLYITTCGALLSGLQALNLRDRAFPKTPEALGRRLHSGRYRSFVVLDEKSAPELQALKRTPTKRPIGLFVPDDDGMTLSDSSIGTERHAATDAKSETCGG